MKKVCPNEYEHLYWKENKLICGIDEAGRGPLAGPLSVAAVVFPAGYENPDIYDSKALSEKKRDALFQTIQEDALWFSIWEVSEKDIDTYNIYRADQRAMTQLAIDSKAPVILTDAMPLPSVEDREVIDLVKGDQKSISIAAASIVAKVYRDHLMRSYAAIYPGYGFDKNVGYGTKQHIEGLKTYGVTPIHRQTFEPGPEFLIK